MKFVTPGVAIIMGLSLEIGAKYLINMERKAYDRGALAMALHHKCKGSYASMGFREVAFKWGDPQTEEDIDTILRLAEEKYPIENIFKD